MREMEYRTIDGTDLKVSVIGFGASPLEMNLARLIRRRRTRRAARYRQRHRSFRCFPYYGRTLAEDRLGKALAGRRSEVVLATKCGRYDVADSIFRRAA